MYIEASREFQRINDTTFRDGQQSGVFSELVGRPRTRLDLTEKQRLLDHAVGLGIRMFEVFSPVVNDAEKEELPALREYIDTQYPNQGIALVAHVRCHMDDIREAVEAGVDGLHMYMSGLDLMMRVGLKRSLQEVVTHVRNTAEEVRRYYPRIYLRHSVEHAFTTSQDNIIAVFDVVSDSVNTLGIPDTNGVATPDKVIALLEFLQTCYPLNALQGHFHNDYGYALINATTAALQGMEIIDGTVLGIAERSGITSITALLFDLYRHNPELLQDYTLSEAYGLNVLMADILGIPVPWNEPVSLSNRTHRAGVHQAASDAYEQEALQKFGVTERSLLLSPLSGWHHVHYYLTHKRYLDVPEEKAREITQRFKAKAEKMNDISPIEVLMEIVSEYSFPQLPTSLAGEGVLENLGD